MPFELKAYCSIKTPFQTTYLKRGMLFAFFFSLVACSGHSPAPVYELSSNQSNGLSKSKNSIAQRSRNRKTNQIDFHLVKPGDTLYSIAWRYAIDYHTLAKANNLANYRIYPGQKLRLNNQSSGSVYSPKALIAAINSDFLNRSIESQSTPTRSNHSPVPTAKSRQTNQIGKNTRKNSKKSSKKINTYPKKQLYSNVGASVGRWIWPVNGQVIEGFSAKRNKNKGLDIKGALGDPVRATAKGKVVYSGSGLKGYGQLVIIKHNEDFLSAYAHNQKIHVEENEIVKAGQRIADLGRSGTDKEKLHFEIRYKGKPVDPLNYLPKS